MNCIKKVFCLLAAAAMLAPYTAFAENVSFPCSSTMKLSEDSKEVTVTLNIPDELKESAAVYVAEYTKDGIVIDLSEISDKSEPFTFLPAENSAQIKAFIWNGLQPLAEVSSENLFIRDEDKLSLMDFIVDKIYNLEPEFEIGDYGVTQDDFNVLWSEYLGSCLQYDHPEIFYSLGECSYEIQGDGTVDTVRLKYGITQDEATAARALIDAEAQKIISMLDNSMTDVEKVLIVHDYIVANYQYDIRVMSDNPEIRASANRTLDKMVEEKMGVCQGYSYLFKYVMNKAGIECVTVPSDECSHMWNKVKIDGKWYNIDLTSDDPIPDQSVNVNHKYFLLSDTEMIAADADSDAALHKTWNKFKWDTVTPSEVADSDDYKDSELRNITGAGIFLDGAFYCFDSDNYICSVDFKDNTLKKVYEGSYFNSSPQTYEDITEFTWFAKGSNSSFYSLPRSAMVLYEGNIYFNSPNKIYMFNPSDNTAVAVVNAEDILAEEDLDISNTYFFGLRVTDAKLIAEGLEELIEIPLNAE